MSELEIIFYIIFCVSSGLNWGFVAMWYNSSSQRWLRHQMGTDGWVHPHNYISHVRRHGIAERQVGREGPTEVMSVESGRRPRNWGQEDGESESIDNLRECVLRALRELESRENLREGETSALSESESRENLREGETSALSEAESRDNLRESVASALSESESRGDLRESVTRVLRESRSQDETYVCDGRVNIDEAVESTLSSIPFEVGETMVHVWNQFDMLFNILACKPLVGCIFLSYQLLKIANQMPNPRVYRWFVLVYILLIFVFFLP